MIRKNIFSLLASFALILTSCDSDAPDNISDGAPVEVSFTLSSLTRGSTRADGTPANPVADNEKIKDWRLIFVDGDSKVVKILNRDDYETGIDNPNLPVERERFKVILPSGSYRVIAFANISEAELKTNAGLEFAEGDEVNIPSILNGSWRNNLNLWNIQSDAIPMTGYRSIEVTNHVQESFAIEVVRMTAKVEFLFTNPLADDITVTSVGIDPVTTSRVSLFPRSRSGVGYSHLGNSAYSPLANATYAAVTNPVDVRVAAGDENVSTTFYCAESIVSRPNGNLFTIALKVRHGNGAEELIQYNLTHDIKNYINRNDWIVIPVTFTNWLVETEALFYPPIGGYPEVKAATDATGCRVYTFGTEGEFEIAVSVIDKRNGVALAPANYRVRNLTETGDNIFSKTPSLTPGTDGVPAEIIGILSTAQGKAEVSVTVDIYENGYQAGAVPTCSYLRTLYIVRDNNI